MEDFVRGSEDIEKVTSMLKRESSFFMGIQRLADALEHLNNFLEGADAKSVEEVMRKSVKSWVEEAEEVAGAKGCLDEDCLIKFSHVLQQRRVINFLSRAGRRFNRLNSGHNEASDFQNGKAVQRSINEFGRTKEEEVVPRTNVVERHNRKPFYAFVEEYVDSKAKDVMVQLIDGAPSCSVISLVGPDGIGKTSLARKVYESQAVRDHFNCRAWIDVKTSYKIKDLLKAVIQQISEAGQDNMERLHGMRAMELIGTLRQILEPKRYMFVFDDISQEEFWHVIKQGLPANDKGSRIIITTHSESIVASDHFHILGPLSESMSGDLFYGIVFQDEPEHRCPAELEQLSIEIVQMFKGFPLPIVAMAGLLSKKEKLLSKWQKLQQNFSLLFKISLHTPRILDVLSFSFNDLPAHLQPCFLYFSIFPEDSIIPNEKLFKLWIAEGFVEEKIEKTLEEVAEEYLNELIHRDLVQSCRGFYGLEQYCQIHKSIHSIARIKADERNFSSIWNENHSRSRIKSGRLSIYNVSDLLERITDYQIHSCFLFNVHGLRTTSLATLIAKCENLTLLYVEYVSIEYIPEGVGNLLNLKYLSVKNTKVGTLPKSVIKLHNLQTLDVRNTPLTEIPMEINSLKNLQHLLASVYDYRTSGESTRGLNMKRGIGSLENLQTLMTVDAHHSGTGLIEELAKLQHLRKLGISGLTKEFGSALRTISEQFVHLEYLTLQAMNNHEILDVETISSPLPLLRRLVLKGILEKLPHWIIGLHSLTTLCLTFSKLTDNPLTHLSQLPNLVSLWLYLSYEEEQLCFEEGGFQRLKLLVLRELHGLNVVEIEEGALPNLEELRIGSSLLLNEVPSGIRHLKNLKVLESYDMPREFVLSMQPDGGSDYWKIEHIPSVLFWYRVEGRSYKLYTLGDSDLLDHLEGLATNKDVIPQRQHEIELSFCESDEEDDDDEVGGFSFSNAPSLVPRKNTKQRSFSSGFYTDDLEE